MRINGLSARHGALRFKFVLAGFAALMLSGCSDSIERFANNYSNPSDEDPVYTASIPKPKRIVRKYQAPKYVPQDVAQNNEEIIVQSPIAKAPVAEAPSYDYTKAYKKTYRQPKLVAEAPVEPAPKYAFNKTPTYKTPSYKPPLVEEEEQQANAAVAEPAPSQKTASATVKVAPGMTLYSIAKANKMTVQKLAEANGIQAPYTVSPGRTLRIPGVRTATLPAVADTKPVFEAQPQQQASVKVKARAGEHLVAQGDTLYSLGRTYGVSPFAIAKLNGLTADKALALGQKLRIPSGGNVAAAKPVSQEQVADAGQSEITEPTTEKSLKPAKLALPKEIPAAKEIADTTPEVQAPVAAPTPAAVQLAMRWPLKGKVISAFGPKPNGMKNEGINIAVPEGTKILAAEAGVVAYAGNELKGYGNLVLIRHSGGYVTAYAHASKLMVKKGDQVKRGDVIAAAGQTGAVQSPQLHFEVRKGATALDPNKFLASSTASN